MVLGGYQFNGPGIVNIVLADYSVETLETAAINVIPEPATMLLLGLGGLLLRQQVSRSFSRTRKRSFCHVFTKKPSLARRAFIIYFDDTLTIAVVY